MGTKNTMEKQLQDLKDDHAKIVKIGWKKEEVYINSINTENGGTEKSTYEGDQPAMPEFYKAFSALGDHVAELLEFPDDWADQAKCIWLSINYEDDKHKRMGVVITLQVPTKRYTKPLTINAPHLKEKIVGTAGAGADFMDTTCLQLVLDLIEEAQRYLDGERAQKTLLDEPKKVKKGKGKKAANDEGKDD